MLNALKRLPARAWSGTSTSTKLLLLLAAAGWVVTLNATTIAVVAGLLVVTAASAALSHSIALVRRPQGVLVATVLLTPGVMVGTAALTAGAWVLISVLAVVTVIALSLAALAFAAWLISKMSGSGGPQAGEVWMVDFPFDDGSGSKVRPALVTRSGERQVFARYITSVNKDDRPEYQPVPSRVGLPKDSWIEANPTALPRQLFIRKVANY